MSGGHLQYAPEKVVLFVKATAVLHNLCRLANLPDPDPAAAPAEEEAEEMPQLQGDLNGLNTRSQLIRDFFSIP